MARVLEGHTADPREVLVGHGQAQVVDPVASRQQPLAGAGCGRRLRLVRDLGQQPLGQRQGQQVGRHLRGHRLAEVDADRQGAAVGQLDHGLVRGGERRLTLHLALARGLEQLAEVIERQVGDGGHDGVEPGRGVR